MSTDLTGTVALITGATSGIGKATAFAFANRGAHVLVGGRNAARAEAVVTSLRARGAKADFIDVDLGSSDSARRAAELGDGHVDILVNNAAIFPMGPRFFLASCGLLRGGWVWGSAVVGTARRWRADMAIVTLRRVGFPAGGCGGVRPGPTYVARLKSAASRRGAAAWRPGRPGGRGAGGG